MDKYQYIANKKYKPLPVIDDDRRLHDNLKILESDSADDSDDLAQKRKIRQEKKDNAKPYRLTYVKLKRKIKQREEEAAKGQNQSSFLDKNSEAYQNDPIVKKARIEKLFKMQYEEDQKEKLKNEKLRQ